MATPKTKTELFKTHQYELIKSYIEFDGAGRTSKVFVASSTALDGAPCQVTEYIYTTPISTIIKARKEGYDVWDATWDADFTVTP